MISFNYIRNLYIVLALALTGSSCGYFDNALSPADSNTGSPKSVSMIPFSTLEPEVFQTEVIVSAFVDDRASEKKYFVAKNGGRRFIVFNYGQPEETSVLEDESGGQFILDGKTRTFRKRPNAFKLSAGNDLKNFLTTKWLNEKRGASFENLGTKDGFTKYRVLIADSVSSESIVFVDDKLGIPVKQEFYSDSKLTFSVEFKNFETKTADKWFQIPPDYRESEPASSDKKQ